MNRRGKGAAAALVAVMIVLATGLPSLASGDAPSKQDGRVLPVAVEGERMSAKLVVMPGDKIAYDSYLQSIFTTSADSLFSCGPNRPHPYSWLTRGVICRDRIDFRIEIVDQGGAVVDTLTFRDVAPAFYSVRIDDVSGLEPGIHTLRYLYGESFVDEAQIYVKVPE